MPANWITDQTGVVLLIEFIWFCIFEDSPLKNEKVFVVMPFNEPRKLIFCKTDKDVLTCASVNVVKPLTLRVEYKTSAYLQDLNWQCLFAIGHHLKRS